MRGNGKFPTSAFVSIFLQTVATTTKVAGIGVWQRMDLAVSRARMFGLVIATKRSHVGVKALERKTRNDFVLFAVDCRSRARQPRLVGERCRRSPVVEEKEEVKTAVAFRKRPPSCGRFRVCGRFGLTLDA
jgi:hypothetical protein